MQADTVQQAEAEGISNPLRPPDVLIYYPDRATYFVAQSRDVMHLIGCGRWRDA